MPRIITVINLSSVVTPAALSAAVVAIQAQIDNQFAPAWSGQSAKLVIGTDVNVAGARMFVMDTTDQADVLGFHQVDVAQDPTGFVFAKTDLDVGAAWQSTLSHEVLEMIADPFCNQGVWLIYQGVPVFADLEVCDAVENDELTISVGGAPRVIVSNFILPAWYEPARAGAKYDYLGRLSQPLTVSPGGYFAYSTDLANWTEVLGQRVPSWQQEPPKYSHRWQRIQKRRSLFVSATGVIAMPVPANISTLLNQTQADADTATASDTTAASAAAASMAADQAAAAAAASQLAAHQKVTADANSLIAAIQAAYEAPTPAPTPGTMVPAPTPLPATAAK